MTSKLVEASLLHYPILANRKNVEHCCKDDMSEEELTEEIFT